METDNILVNLKSVSLMHSDNKTRALQDISMEVRSGEKIFIFAQPYIAAVHLLRICATMYPPSSGTVTVFGKETNELEFQDLLPIKRYIGFVERISSLISNRSLFENITLGLRYHHNISIDEARSKAHDYLLHFGLLENINDRPAWTPLEKQRMTLFCRELLLKPNLLILEKPSYGLSRDELKLLMEAILDYQAESNCGMIISDDDADFFTQNYDFPVYDLIDGCLTG
jgi:ABC-type ATPase involved in cell division